ncbi:hypothetical protein MTO96_033752 [Rhipicephalus appendiculatus]
MERPSQLSDKPSSAFLDKALPTIYEKVRIHDTESSGQLLKTWQASFFTSRKEEGKCNEQYLEIGCGPGNFTRHHLLPHCPPVHEKTSSGGQLVPHDRLRHSRTWPPEDRIPNAGHRNRRRGVSLHRN